MNNRLFVTLLALLWAAICPAAGPCQSTQPDGCVIRIASSKDISNRLDAWGRAYADRKNHCRITVTGMRDTKAFQALLDQDVDLCLTGRELTQEEKKAASNKGVRLAQRLVCNDAIAVITHPQLPVDSLTLQELKSIYAGTLTNWKQIGGPDLPVLACSVSPESSSVAKILDDMVFKGVPSGKGVRVMRSEKHLIEHLAVTEGAIGYSSFMYLIDDRGPDPHVVKLPAIRTGPGTEAIKPTPASVKSATYPLVRSFYFNWQEGKIDQRTKEFVEFFKPAPY
ncbi:MAG: substrate-binding domain-containing protein [Thermodesulfobacteriota bacterium]